MAKVSMIIDVMTKGEKGLDSVSKKLNNMADAQKRLNRDISTKQYTKDSSIYNMNLHDSNYRRLKDIRDIIKSNIDIQKEQFSSGFAKDESLRKKYDGVVESLKLMDISGKRAVKTLTDLRNLSDIYGGKYTTAYRKVENQFFKDEGIDLDYKNLKNIEKSMKREAALYTKYQERAIKAEEEVEGFKKSNAYVSNLEQKFLNLKSLTGENGLLKNLKATDFTLFAVDKTIGWIINSTKKEIKYLTDLYKQFKKITEHLSNKLYKSFNSIAHVFKYMILRMSFRALIKDWQTFFTYYAQVSEEFNAEFSKLYSSVKRVTAAFISAFAPVIQALTPILTMFTNAIYSVLDALAQLNSALFLGQTSYISAKDYMRDFADEMDNAKGSASGLNKQLASFDTINKLTDNKGGGSGSLEDANKIFGSTPIATPIQEFVKRLTEAWNNNDLSPIGEELASKLKGIVEKGLEIFDEDNFKDTILPKISGVRKGLTAFFKKINDDNTSYDFGKLAGSVVNDIVDSINEIFARDGNTSWYEEMAESFANFIIGAVDQVDFKDLGKMIATIGNLINRIKARFWEAMNAKDEYGRTGSQKLADGIKQMLIESARNFDAEASINAWVNKIEGVIDIALGYFEGKGVSNFIKGANSTAYIMNSGLGDSFARIGGKLLLLLGDALAAGMSTFLGRLVGMFGMVFEQVPSQDGTKTSIGFMRDGIVATFSGDIIDKNNGLPKAIDDGIDSISKEIDNKQSTLKSQGEDWGKNILSGVVYGLQNVTILGKITNAALNIAKTIKTAFTSKGDENGGGVDENSPSKVFEKFGQYILEGLQNGLEGKLDSSSLLEKIQTMKDGVLNIKDELINSFGLVQDSLTPIFEAISDSFKTQLELMVSNLNITIRCIKSGLQNMVDAMNDIIDDYNSAAREVGGRTISYVGRVNLNTIPVPKLATGAVIPPNKPFMAVMGDQKSGTNIEAPLETIKQALSEVMSNRLSREVVLEVDGREFGRAVLDLGNQEQRRVGTRFITQ